MGLGGLSDMLGMGVIIQLRNMFSVPALAVERSSNALTKTILKNQSEMTKGFGLMTAGGLTMLAGTGMLAGIVAIAKVSLEASNNMELLRKQINMLTKSESVGGKLFTDLKQFSLTTPFTIDKIMESAKLLLGFGFHANNVVSQLHTIGEVASIMKVPIEEAAVVWGRVRAGSAGYALRYLRRMGIDTRDIAAAGGPVNPKTHMFDKGADPEKILAALNKVVEQKYAGGMSAYMTTLPGMYTNLKDQLIYFLASVGDQFKDGVKNMMQAVISVFKPDLIQPFAVAVGSGFNMILKWATAALVPIAKFAVWIMQLSKEHPGVIRLAMGLAFLASVTTLAVGAAMVLMGAIHIGAFLLASEAVAAFGASILSLTSPIALIAVVAGLFYVSWKNNFLGIRDSLISMYNTFTLVMNGVTQLVTSCTQGIGHMSQTTWDALGRSGLQGLVVGLFMAFYRAYQFILGFWDGVQQGIAIVAYLGTALAFVLKPVIWLVEGLWNIAEALGWVGNKISSSAWRNFGQVVGDIAAAFIVAKGVALLWNGAMFVGRAVMLGYSAALGIARGAMLLWASASKICEGAAWLLDIALDANPISLIVMGVAALVIGLILLFTHLKQVSDWWDNLPGWGKMLMQLVLGPIMALAQATMFVYKHWDAIKSWFQSFGNWLKSLWGVVIDYLTAKISALLGWLQKIMGGVNTWLQDNNGSELATVGNWIYNKSNQMRGAEINLLTGAGRKVGGAFTKAADYLEAPQSQGSDAWMKAHELRPIQVHTELHLDGKVVGKAVTKHQVQRHDGDNN